MKESYYVFIDESGNTDTDLSVDKTGVSNFVIYAAVIIEQNELDNARKVLDNIYDKHFRQNRYLKSSRIHNDENGYGKTISILTELKKLKHYVYAIIVDKKSIHQQSQLTKKTVFIKYFNRLLAEHIYKEETEIHITFDKTGDSIFDRELKSYMDRFGCGQTLFSNNTYTTADDETEEKLLQLADFYAGTFGKYYCGKFEENKANVINDGFIKKIASIEWYPRNTVPMFAADTAFDSKYNESITKIAIASAERYLDKFSDDTVGCELILYILQETHRNPLRYISSKEIKQNLRARHIEIGDPIVKISELRSKGVLLISPIGKKGYKIPNNEQEIAEFYNRLIGNVQPQLKRCYIFNNVLLEQSNGQYNILASSEFELLSHLCDLVTSQRAIKP